MMCNWYIKDELLVDFDKIGVNDGFLFYARTEPSREVVFAPHLNSNDISWEGHYSNRELIVMPRTWNVAFQACVYINNVSMKVK